MEKNFDRASECLKALSHPLRLKILESLKGGEKSVTEIENFCGDYTQSNISQHLSLMKSKDIIGSNKIANQVFYSVSKKEIYKILDLIAKIFCNIKR